MKKTCGALAISLMIATTNAFAVEKEDNTFKSIANFEKEFEQKPCSLVKQYVEGWNKRPYKTSLNEAECMVIVEAITHSLEARSIAEEKIAKESRSAGWERGYKSGLEDAKTFAKEGMRSFTAESKPTTTNNCQHCCSYEKAELDKYQRLMRRIKSDGMADMCLKRLGYNLD